MQVLGGFRCSVQRTQRMKTQNLPACKQMNHSCCNATAKCTAHAAMFCNTAFVVTHSFARADDEPTKQTNQRSFRLTEPTNQSTQQLSNQPTRASTNEPTNQPTNQLSNEQKNERTNQPTNQRTNQRTNHTNQPTNEPTHQRINERTNERTEPMNEPTNELWNERTNELWNERTHFATNQRTNELWNKLCNEHTLERTLERTLQRTNERTSERTNERTNERTRFWNEPTTDKNLSFFRAQPTTTQRQLALPCVYTVHCTLFERRRSVAAAAVADARTRCERVHVQTCCFRSFALQCIAVLCIALHSKLQHRIASQSLRNAMM